MIENTSERRKFYRVNESASIELLPINDDSTFPFSKFDESSTLFHLNELKQTEIDTRQILAQISEKDRLLGIYLKALNKKLDTLTNIVATSAMLIDENTVHNISLSEGGFSVQWASPYNAGQVLACKLIIVEDLTGLICKSRVVDCQPIANDLYDIHCEYLDLDDPKRMLLARHIIRKQIRQRQQLEKNSRSQEV